MSNLRNESTHPLVLHRIGAVSRLSGVPVSTLRIWEQRYGAFEPAKTAGQHRLYGDADVARARLMRQLTEAGHSISSVARLDARAMQALQGAALGVSAAESSAQPAPGPLRLVLVGPALVARLEGRAWQALRLPSALEVVAAHADLDALMAAPAPEGGVDLLLVRLDMLHADTAGRLAQAMARVGGRRVLVLYNFARTATVSQLGLQGVELRREPVPDSELADLLLPRLRADAPLPGPLARVPQRRYSDETLVEVAARPSSILCECPRHIADLIAQLASFEQYSETCLSETAEDAEVHAYLKSMSGTCRAMMEVAMDRVLAHAAAAGAEAAT